MIKKKGRLVVFDGKKLAGIVTASDLVSTKHDLPETMLKVDDFDQEGHNSRRKN